MNKRNGCLFVLAATLVVCFAQPTLDHLPNLSASKLARRSGQFGPLIPVDDQRPVAADGMQGPPVIAASSDGFFAVWTDTRRPRSGAELWGTRISKAGEILDIGGVRLTDIYQHISAPAIASDGRNCLVVFQSFWFDAWVHGLLVVNGRPSVPFLITTNGGEPEVAFAGGQYLVAWGEPSVGQEPRGILAQRFSITGHPIDVEPFLIYSTTNQWRDLRIAGKTGQFLVGWTESFALGNTAAVDIQGAFVDVDEIIHISQPFPISTTATYKFLNALAYQEDTFLAVWNATRPNGAEGLHTVSIKSDGTVSSPNDVAARTGFNAALAPIPAGYLMLYATAVSAYEENVVAMAISRTGAPLTDSTQVANSRFVENNFPTVAANGTNLFAGWFSKPYGVCCVGDINGTSVSETGQPTVLNGYSIATRHAPQARPAVACNGRNYLVAWNDLRNAPESSTIYATRVSFDGAVLDPVPIEIGGGGGVEIAASGGNYIVVFDVGGFMGRRMIDTDGRFIEPVVIDPSAEWRGASPILVGGDDGFLVGSIHTLREDFRYGWRLRTELHLMRLNQNGEPIETQWAVNPGAGTTLWPAAAARGRDYLITWSEAPQSWGSSLNLSQKAFLLTPQGHQPVTDFGTQVVPSFQEFNNQVAANGSRYLFTWAENSNTTGQLHAVFLDRKARPLGHPMKLANIAGTILRPTVGAIGEKFLLAWTEQYSPSNAVITGACIRLSGSIETLGVIDSVIGMYNYSYARVATDERARVLFVTQRYESSDESAIFAAPWRRK